MKRCVVGKVGNGMRVCLNMDISKAEPILDEISRLFWERGHKVDCDQLLPNSLHVPCASTTIDVDHQASKKGSFN